MVKLLILFLLLNTRSWSQDERFFRDLLSPELEVRKEVFDLDERYKWIAKTPTYQVNLNDLPGLEGIQVQKRDGKDFVILKDMNGLEIKTFELSTTGFDSYLFKIRLVNLSSKVRALILFFFEGKSNYIDYHGRGSLYFISFEGKEMKNLNMVKGPPFMYERETFNDEYGRRDYKIVVHDYNKDGIKEIGVKYGEISRVWFYQGAGNWINY